MRHIFIIIIFLFLANCTNQNNNQKIEEVNMDEFVPRWAKKVIWYQIFPDRFRNGDKSNDPTVESIEGSWPHDHTSPWQVHPWNADWYKMQPWEIEKIFGSTFSGADTAEICRE